MNKFITVRLDKIKNARKIELWKRAGYKYNDSHPDYVIFWRVNPRLLKTSA